MNHQAKHLGMARSTAAGTVRRRGLGNRFSVLLFGLAIVTVFLYPPGGAVARAPERAGAREGAAGGRKAHEPAPAARRRTTGGESQIEEFDIVGKIYKPEVFVFLGRKTLNLSWDLDDARFKRSFLDAVINSVWGPPF
ncbi:MAG: hypothetical protein ABI333_25450 [bacterium]